MTELIQIPLNKLSLWPGNVRKTDTAAGVDELAASIASHGLLQSLVVRKSKRGRYDIVAGQRRFLALQKLIESGTIPADHPVPCMQATSEVDAAELSLAENAVRVPMHPADQFEAFRSVIDQGASVADVAARFGISEAVVSKRLKLGRLSPMILEAYRQAEIDLDQAQAFTLTDDHVAQERVLADLPEWNRSSSAIRRALTCGEVPTSDKRVSFVGLDFYIAAGGVIRQDLFDEDGSGYVTDVALLDRLVVEKLEGARSDLLAAGWSWVDIVPEFGWEQLRSFGRAEPAMANLSDADQQELERLENEYDALVDDDEADQQQIDAVEHRIDALRALRSVWCPETLAFTGAIVSLDYRGQLALELGLVRKGDAPRQSGPTGDGLLKASEKGLSPKLVEDLTAQRSAAIGAELLARPDLALAAIVHALALDTFYVGSGVATCLTIKRQSCHLNASMADAVGCKALTAIGEVRERMGDILPGDATQLWQWVLTQSRDELLQLLALISAMSVDAIDRKNGNLASEGCFTATSWLRR